MKNSLKIKPNKINRIWNITTDEQSELRLEIWDVKKSWLNERCTEIEKWEVNTTERKERNATLASEISDANFIHRYKGHNRITKTGVEFVST